MDKQIYSLGKSQLYLEKSVKKLLRMKSSIILESPHPSPPSTVVLESPPPVTSFIISSPKVQKVREEPDEPKILEISDSESDLEPEIKNVQNNDADVDTDSDDDAPFDDKTLDLELKNELKELKA
jgi:hypothetical protein